MAQHRLLLTCQRMTLGEPDGSGRRQPIPVAGSEFTLECSTVIAAIGQSVEREVAERDGVQVTGWGLAADETTLATNVPGVFAGGDAVLGPDLAVRAVAAGRMAAVSIDQYLRGEAVTGEPATGTSHCGPWTMPSVPRSSDRSRAPAALMRRSFRARVA